MTHFEHAEGSTRLLLVADQREWAGILLQSLAKRRDIEIVGCATNGALALDLARETRPGVVLIDLTTPVLTAEELVPLLRRVLPAARLWVFLAPGAHHALDAWRSLGADGTLEKAGTWEALLRVVSEVIGGAPAPQEAEPPTPSRLPPASKPPIPLTPQEQRVLRLLAEGGGTRGLAEVLDLSERTVEGHRERIMYKLGLPNLAMLTRYALAHGLTELKPEDALLGKDRGTHPEFPPEPPRSRGARLLRVQPPSKEELESRIGAEPD